MSKDKQTFDSFDNEDMKRSYSAMLMAPLATVLVFYKIMRNHPKIKTLVEEIENGIRSPPETESDELLNDLLISIRDAFQKSIAERNKYRKLERTKEVGEKRKKKRRS